MGAFAVGATIYFGSAESRRQLTEIAAAFEHAHDLGMATILWCYLRNNAFKKDGVDYHNAADLTGQADHLGATIGADIVKQKLPTCNGGFRAIGFGKTDDKMYTGRHQQAGRRHGAYQRPQGVPKADERGHRTAPCHPRRLSRSFNHHRINPHP